MQSLFYSAVNFNQNISNWNVSNVINMNSMFSGATNFNKDISSWNVCKVEDYEYFSSFTLSRIWLEEHKPNFGDSEKCSGN
jgi:surface protein